MSLSRPDGGLVKFFVPPITMIHGNQEKRYNFLYGPKRSIAHPMVGFNTLKLSRLSRSQANTQHLEHVGETGQNDLPGA